MRKYPCPSVLVVDDDDDVRLLISVVLSGAGYRVREVADAEAALAAVGAESFDVYVIDVRMPGMNGRDLCRKLKSGPVTARPVMLISAESSIGDVAAAHAAGCDDFLFKPFSPRELQTRVAALVDQASACAATAAAVQTQPAICRSR